MPFRVEQFRARLPLTAFNFALMIGGTAVCMPLLEKAVDDSFPGPGLFALQLLTIFVFDDTLFYFWHRWLHRNEMLYRRIHRIHHRAFAPFPIDYMHVHPVEWLVGTLGPLAAMFLLASTVGLSLFALAFYVALRQIHELLIHAPIRSRLLTKQKIISVSEKHQQHHARPHSGNFGSIFCHWDRILKTRAASGADTVEPAAAD